MKQYIITGIGTDVGKTVVSAIVSEALKATYWKPVQAGDLDNSDSIKIGQLTKNVSILPEAFQLTEPMSPHAAADIDGVEISPEDLSLPEVEGNFVVEGAGGLLVPINSKGFLYADAFENWKLPTIVVSRHYLGSINHTLMTIEILKNRGVEIEGIIFVGNAHPTTEKIILDTTECRFIARIPLTSEVNQDFVLTHAEKIKYVI
ncbi:MAG: dethiobiotin synthase [Crocinitomicaceae bacterium]|nr:dethiobiotin synthase [Crocinitomicaceae bacterium]